MVVCLSKLSTETYIMAPPNGYLATKIYIGNVGSLSWKIIPFVRRSTIIKHKLFRYNRV